MGYYGYGMGGGLLWFVYLAIAAFIFGIIFWWTKSLFDKEGKNSKDKNGVRKKR